MPMNHFQARWRFAATENGSSAYKSSMRLTDQQARSIKQLAHEIAGERTQVRVFGSRLDDRARGGDLDLMLELPEPAANLALLAENLVSRRVQ